LQEWVDKAALILFADIDKSTGGRAESLDEVDASIVRVDLFLKLLLDVLLLGLPLGLLGPFPLLLLLFLFNISVIV